MEYWGVRENKMKKRVTNVQARELIATNRGGHEITRLIVIKTRKAIPSQSNWQTAAIVQLLNIFKLRMRDARALVSEWHLGKTIFANNDLNPHGFVVVPALARWSCNWDKKMLDIPTI